MNEIGPKNKDEPTACTHSALHSSFPELNTGFRHMSAHRNASYNYFSYYILIDKTTNNHETFDSLSLTSCCVGQCSMQGGSQYKYWPIITFFQRGIWNRVLQYKKLDTLFTIRLQHLNTLSFSLSQSFCSSSTGPPVLDSFLFDQLLTYLFHAKHSGCQIS